jgi:hypothetical protein
LRKGGGGLGCDAPVSMSRSRTIAQKLDSALPSWLFGVHGVIWWAALGVTPAIALGVALLIDGHWYGWLVLLVAIPPAMAMVRDGLNKKI